MVLVLPGIESALNISNVNTLNDPIFQHKDIYWFMYRPCPIQNVKYVLVRILSTSSNVQVQEGKTATIV